MTLEIALLIVGFLIVIVGLVSGIAGIWLVNKYYRFNRMENSLRLTGIEIARKILPEGLIVYTEDKYVYLADGGTWNGFRNSLGNTAGTPYFTCPVHTHNYWEGIYGEDGYTGDEGSGDWENPASPGTGW